MHLCLNELHVHIKFHVACEQAQAGSATKELKRVN